MSSRKGPKVPQVAKTTEPPPSTSSSSNPPTTTTTTKKRGKQSADDRRPPQTQVPSKEEPLPSASSSFNPLPPTGATKKRGKQSAQQSERRPETVQVPSKDAEKDQQQKIKSSKKGPKVPQGAKTTEPPPSTSSSINPPPTTTTKKRGKQSADERRPQIQVRSKEEPLPSASPSFNPLPPTGATKKRGKQSAQQSERPPQTVQVPSKDAEKDQQQKIKSSKKGPKGSQIASEPLPSTSSSINHPPTSATTTTTTKKKGKKNGKKKKKIAEAAAAAQEPPPPASNPCQEVVQSDNVPIKVPDKVQQERLALRNEIVIFLDLDNRFLRRPHRNSFEMPWETVTLTPDPQFEKLFLRLLLASGEFNKSRPDQSEGALIQMRLHWMAVANDFLQLYFENGFCLDVEKTMGAEIHKDEHHDNKTQKPEKIIKGLLKKAVSVKYENFGFNTDEDKDGFRDKLDQLDNLPFAEQTMYLQLICRGNFRIQDKDSRYNKNIFRLASDIRNAYGQYRNEFLKYNKNRDPLAEKRVLKPITDPDLKNPAVEFVVHVKFDACVYHPPKMILFFERMQTESANYKYRRVSEIATTLSSVFTKYALFRTWDWIGMAEKCPSTTRFLKKQYVGQKKSRVDKATVYEQEFLLKHYWKSDSAIAGRKDNNV